MKGPADLPTCGDNFDAENAPLVTRSLDPRALGPADARTRTGRLEGGGYCGQSPRDSRVSSLRLDAIIL